MAALTLRRAHERRRLDEMVTRREQQRHSGDDHGRDRDETAGRGAGGERAPVAAVFGRPAGSQRGRKGGPARSPAVERRSGHAKRREHQQRGEQPPAELSGPAQRRGDASQAEHREQRLSPVGAQGLPPPGLLAGLGRTQERGLAREQPEHRRPRDHQRRRLPDKERPDRVPPGRAGAAAQQRDGPDQAEHHEHRNRRDEEHGELAEQRAAAESLVGGPGQQEDQEGQPEEVAVPLDAAGQVGPALSRCQVVLL